MFEKKEKYTGQNWDGETVSFNKVWGGHEFTDDECKRLLNGEKLCLTDCISKNGNNYGCYGILAKQEYNGHIFWGFKKTEWLNEDRIPNSWCGHEFTDDERKILESGQTIVVNDAVAYHFGKVFSCVIGWQTQGNSTQKHIVPIY